MMLSRKFVPFVVLAFLFSCAACVPKEEPKPVQLDQKVPRTTASYLEAGKHWGHKLWILKVTPNTPLNEDFVRALASPQILDYFNVHSDLKEAFKKGFRLGYEDRIADLVLGPHVTEAAGRIGYATSKRFVEVITAFEVGWAKTLKNAVDIFIVLISEGSQADREIFIKNFTEVYTKKYEATQKILNSGRLPSGKWMTQISAGGTVLYLDYTKGKALGVLDIPSPSTLKTEIYHQTFKVMGDEWGRRYKTNLIRRDEIIDLLRRIKPSLQEVTGNNLGIIYGYFIESFGPHGKREFALMLKEANYESIPKPVLLEPGGIAGSKKKQR